jgi:molybdopterin-guanine dinucleotide biosynthesis adapter protein
MPSVLSIVGWHNAGKTTLCVRLVEALKARGLRVAVLKHSVAGFEMDRPGTDTTKFAEAGADLVVISSPTGLAWLERPPTELSLEEILLRMPPDIDLVVVEGFKREPTLKIEVIRAETGSEPIARPEDLLAIVSDDEDFGERGAPRFATGDVDGLVALLERRGIVPRATG